MNEKVIPIDEVRTFVRTHKCTVEAAMSAAKIFSGTSWLDEKVMTEQELSHTEWILQSAEFLLPVELHSTFQESYLKRWDKYICAMANCENFDICGKPTSDHVLNMELKTLKWAKEYIQQNSSKYQEYMNKARRLELQAVCKALLSILGMKAKKDVVETLETAISDLELARDEEETAKDSLPENFFLTERYGNMEDNVNDLYTIVDSVSDVLEDVQSLRKFSADYVKEDIESIVNDIKTVINR